MMQIYRDYITGGGEVFDIFIDAAADLPADGVICGRTAALGSSALDVSSGTLYRLTSGGVWVNQSSGTKTIQITSQPESAEVIAGEDVTFTADASGYELTCKWQTSADGSSWSDVSGAVSKTYTFTADSADNGKYFRCLFMDGDTNTAATTAAELTVTEPEVTPEVTPEENSEETPGEGE